MNTYPVICEVAVILTDGERFARLSGPVVNGNVPDKKWLLGVIAGAIITTEDNEMDGFRVPSPRELAEFIAQEMGMGRIGVVGGPEAWEGFTQNELDDAVAEARKTKADDMEEE